MCSFIHLLFLPLTPLVLVQTQSINLKNLTYMYRSILNAGVPYFNRYLKRSFTNRL